MLTLARRAATTLTCATLAVAVGAREASAAVPSCNDFEARIFNDPAGDLPYRLLIPAGYDAAQKYPLVLALHGAGERGNDNCNQFGQPGPLNFASTEAAAKYPAFVVFPQCPSGQQWVDTPWANGSYVLSNVPVSNEISAVLKVLVELQQEFSIDANRLYVTGISMGGFGTWDIMVRNPDLFAAGVPMSGSGSPSSAALIKSLPIWNFHGNTDTVVPTLGSQEMVAALKAVDSPVVYTEYPGGHDGWTTQYNADGLVDWLFSQARASAPAGGAGGASGGGASGGGAASSGSGGAAVGGTGVPSGGSGGAGGGATAGQLGMAGSAGSGVSQAMPGSAGDSGGCTFSASRNRAPAGAAFLVLALAFAGLCSRRKNTLKRAGRGLGSTGQTA